MSSESAQQFVSRMKKDKAFRAAVQQVADVAALNDYLRDQGFEFNQRELVGAMAACMTELDAMSQSCCSREFIGSQASRQCSASNLERM